MQAQPPLPPQTSDSHRATTAPELDRWLASGAHLTLKVSGYSMSPCLRPEDLLTLAPHHPAAGSRFGGGEVGWGDIVVTVDGPGWLAHRVIRKSKTRVQTRGDSARQADPEVRREQVLGVICRVERQGRRVRLGLGPERYVIAWLSRLGLLLPVLNLLRQLKPRAAPRR